MANKVYDPRADEEHAPASDDLSARNTPAGKPYDPRGHDVAAGDPSDPRGDGLDGVRQAENGGGLYNSGGDSGGRNGGLAPSSLKNEEEQGAEESGLAKGFDGPSPNSTSRRRVRISRRQALLGGGAITGIGGTVAVISLLLIPLKVEHIVQNIEQRFFASSKSAVGNETQTMFEHYVVKRVLPEYSRCGTTVSKNCTAAIVSGSNNPVSNLYNAWSQGRLENKLATKYGIEFQHRPNGWYLKAPGISGGEANIGQSGERLDSVFQKSNVSEMRRAIKDETRWYQVMIRYKVGRLLEEKYGIKRCIVFCGITDPLKDSINDQKIAAKLYLNDRVIGPRDKVLAAAVECLLKPECDPAKTSPSNKPGEQGAPISDAEASAESSLDQYAAARGVDKAALEAQLKTLKDDGFQKTFILSVIKQVFPGAASRTTLNDALDAVPIIGWINLGAQVINAANSSGPKIKALSYMVNSASAVQMFMMYRTYADEIHTGHVTATEVGSFVNSLGSDIPTKDPKNPEVGGTAQAQETPLYSSLIDHNAKPGGSKNYKCNDGKPVPAGKLVCAEEELGVGNGVANDIHDVLQTTGLNILTSFATLWHSLTSGVFSAASSVLGTILSVGLAPLNALCGIPVVGHVLGNLAGLAAAMPGYCSVKDAIKSEGQDIMNLVISWLIPSPFGENMSGGRKADMMIAGGDVAGNNYAHNGLGGKALTSGQVADIANQQDTEARQQFSQEPFFARMFNTSSQYSLVTQVAMAMPSNLQSSAGTTFSTIIGNPFGALGSSFASIFSGKSSAASTPQDDPFGVTQYGYTQSDLSSIGDPEAYWDQNCVDDASQGYQQGNAYNAAAGSVQDSNGIPKNTTANPCMLLKATVGSAGGVYDTSLLTQDDMADVNGSSSANSSTSSAGPITAVSGNAQQLAQQILANSKINLDGRLVPEDIRDAAAGKPSTAGAPISSAILQLIATVGQSHSVGVSAIESGGSGHASGSYHYTGDAVDFNIIDGNHLSGRDPGSLAIIQIATSVLPSGSAFGQASCGSTPPLPSGFSTFDDTCNHLHVQVPRGTP